MMETCPLCSVVDVSAGQPAPKANEFAEDGKPFIRAGSLENLLGGGSLSDCEKVPESTAKRKRLRLYPKDSIVFAKSGMSATLGRIYRLSEPAYVVSHLAVLVPTGRYDPSFLTHWLRSNPPSYLIKDPAYPSIRVRDIEDIRVPHVSLREQQRIAAILDIADGIRRKRELALEMADKLLQAVFLEMFGDPVTNPKRLPMRPIKLFGDVVTGNTPSRETAENYGDGIEWIKSDNINTPSHFVTTAQERLSAIGERIARKVPAGSTLVTCIAGSADCIGNAALTDREVAFNQQINAIVPGKTTDPYFLYVQVLTAKQLIQRASTNSMKGMVSKGRFQEIEFLAPRQDDQRKFGEMFKRILRCQDTIRMDALEAKWLFSSISQCAFRGEL